MTYIDIHCHLDFPDLLPNIGNIIQNAKKANVKIILTQGVDSNSNENVLKIVQKFNIVKPCLGFYPPIKNDGKTKNDFTKSLIQITNNKDKILAIGEVGLDYKESDNKDFQIECFTSLIKLSNKLNKPLIIHSRNAESDVIDLLIDNKAAALLHCFCGKKKLIEKARDEGFYFSIPTNVVRAENFQILAKMVSINQLFCETDAPFLSPYKDKLNEPAFVIESYKKLAELKGLTLEEVKNNIYMNYQKLFL